MRQAKNIKVGSVVQFPWKCFDERRTGWNGWLFRCAIVEKLGKNANGEKCAVIRYCTKHAGRYQLLPNEETTRGIKAKFLYEYDVDRMRNLYHEFREAEEQGEQVCWDEDMALLVNHGLV